MGPESQTQAAFKHLSRLGSSSRFLGRTWREAADVSTQVASHTVALPIDHGTIVIPSGLLPSSLNKPENSNCAEIDAEARARWTIISLIAP
ncbi:jg6286 [Pararge aegeria aegeria]|uniref:Jg6286 protein n=1 Tax=Pararge aegeria aegeria TaxID=348720 RepID=A0A8S4SLU9_9NEOP|nr:jg6286 [Pararge aegeria aegeria]